MKQIITTQKQILEDNGIEPPQGEEELPALDQIEIELEEDDVPDQTHSNPDDEEIFDNFDDGEADSYKNFEFGKNKYINRNHSAKKELSEKRNKKDDLNFRKKDKQVKQLKELKEFKDIPKEKSVQKGNPLGDFGLKGVKMNVKKKR